MTKAIELSNKYDEFGKLKTEPWPDIKKGDKVHYLETIIRKNKKAWVHHYGVWDGEKATFENSDLVVRTTRWLTKIN